jgi:thermolysin
LAAVDRRRATLITTYDLRGDSYRAGAVLSGEIDLGPTDVATSSTAVWSDGVVVDAHAHAGATCDFYLQQFGRHGLDGRDSPIATVVHPGLSFSGAAWDGRVLILGDGPGAGQAVEATRGKPSWGTAASALDIVAHELSHAVIDGSAGLVYRNESGALSEAFADIMGAAVEFGAAPAGHAVPRGDYVIGTEAIVGGVRSLAQPAIHGYPDHESRRWTSAEDNGSVHANSTIISHAFYLAVEGGTNATSGFAVEGVGSANRGQIERTFYRAFVYFLTSDASFADVRDATMQSARDLFGDQSAALRAVTQAFTAVGIR